MIYTCVDVQRGRARNGLPFYVSFFMPKGMENCPFIRPYKLFGTYPIGWMIYADVVNYKLPCKMKNKRGIIFEELHLFCQKHFDKHLKKWFYVESPEVIAQKHINGYLTPVGEQ